MTLIATGIVVDAAFALRPAPPEVTAREVVHVGRVHGPVHFHLPFGRSQPWSRFKQVHTSPGCCCRSPRWASLMASGPPPVCAQAMGLGEGVGESSSSSGTLSPMCLRTLRCARRRLKSPLENLSTLAGCTAQCTFTYLSDEVNRGVGLNNVHSWFKLHTELSRAYICKLYLQGTADPVVFPLDF